MKQRLRIIDKQFAHSNGGSFGTGDLNVEPTYFSWHRGIQMGDVVVITESSFNMVDSLKEKIKIALIIEPSKINQQAYTWIYDNWQKFDYILTHNKALLHESDKFIYYHFAGSWIKKEDWKVYPKTKGISIIASGKKQTEGQLLRHKIIEKWGNLIDVYGRGYNPIDYKLDGLKDYKYHIVVENQMTNGWHTEKIQDAFLTGSIPIYYGDPGIGKYFDKSGMFHFKTMDELEQIITLIESGLADRCINKEAVERNFEVAKQYAIPEDWIYLNFLKPKNLL